MFQFSSVFSTYLRKAFIPAFVSLIISYTVYAWILQTPYFYSRTRLALSGLLWVTLTALLLIFRLDRPSLLQQPWRKLIPGIGSLLIIFNLVISLYLVKIPYTYLLLPKQTVVIQPLTLDGEIEIVSFTTENEGLQKIKRFLPTDRWEGLGQRITHIPGGDGALTWLGKPGQMVEIQFKTCPNCGVVEVQSGGETDRLNLSQSEPDGVAIYKKRYASLIFHRVANLVMLEVAALCTATLLIMAARHLIEILSRKKNFLSPSINLSARWENAAVFGSLAALTAINYGTNLQPILYNDDWCQIAYDAHAGNLSLFMLTSRRPLHLFFAALYNNFMSIDQLVFALYLTQLVVLALTAYMIYRFVRECFDASAGLGLLSAALWLVYPNDYTYIYLIMLAGRTALLLSIVYFMLILRIIRNGNWAAVVASLAVTVLGLLMYEGQLGIIIVGPIILALLKRKQLTRNKIAAIAASYTGIAAFIIWRLFFQPLFYQDTKLAALEIQPRELVSQWLLTVKTLFGGFRFPAGNVDWLSPESRWIVLLLVVGVILIAVIFLTLPATQGKKSPLTQVAVGAILWTAGYFPILLNFPVNIYSHLSRVNLFANLGAALLVIGLLHTLTANLGSARITYKLLLASTLPLLFIASLVQLQVQEANRQSWGEAKTFYTRLIELVPDIKPETQVFFTISVGEPAGPIRRPLFTSPWEAECVVWTLYGTARPNLLVGYKYDDIYVPPFPGYNILAGALARNSNDVIPDTSKLLVLNYDLPTTTLEVTQDIGFLDVEKPQAYHPENRILPISRNIPARKLIAPE